MDVREIRKLFPGCERQVYLDAAGLSVPSTRTLAAIERFLQLALVDPAGAYHGAEAEQARVEAARLVGARPEQIALTPSTSLSLTVAADAVPLAAGDNVITSDLEFMSVVVPWLEKCQHGGAELRVVRHQQGRIPATAVIDLIDSHTRAVVLSAVEWTNGFRLDLAPIGAECRRRGIAFVVDAIQQLGVVPLDVGSTSVDFLACGGHKWLASPSALGFSYISDEFASRYRPSLTYAPTAIPPTGDWLEGWTHPDYDPIRTYDLRPDASRFEVGAHHAALGAAGLSAALSIFNEAGPEQIWDHIFALEQRLTAGLDALGLEIVTPLEREHRSGITTFRAGPSAANDIALREYLLERDIAVSVRYTSGIGGVRVSTHVYNDETDIDRLLEATGDWLHAR